MLSEILVLTKSTSKKSLRVPAKIFINIQYAYSSARQVDDIPGQQKHRGVSY